MLEAQKPSLRCAAFLGAAATAAACSPGSVAGGDGGAEPAFAGDDGGSQPAFDLHVSAAIPGQLPVSRMTYAVSSAQLVVRGSTDTTEDAGVLTFTIAGVPGGMSYSLALTATTDDGTATCSFPTPGTTGEAPVVTGVMGRVEDVSVQMQCISNLSPITCCIAVTSNCPVWNEVVATPTSLHGEAGPDDAGEGDGSAILTLGGTARTVALTAGQQLLIVAAGIAPDPSLVTFKWSTTGGSVVGAPSVSSTDAGVTNEAVFTCPPGPASIEMVTVSLADVPDGSNFDCDPSFTTATLTVACPGDEGGCDGGCDATGAESGD